jgi:Phosphodiester glycosidase
VRDPYRPLGEVRLAGTLVDHEPVAAPWASARACVHVDGAVRLARREELGADPPGDLVQAGPLLVHEGRSVVDGADEEGFSAGAAQFDSDITVGRYPRCALGVNDDELLAVCCDGRRYGVDAGLELAELARLMMSFGAREAINLDGGGSATLVHRGHLLNRPYSDHDQPAPESRPIVTALLFERA